jgi:hypothetical protein
MKQYQYWLLMWVLSLIGANTALNALGLMFLLLISIGSGILAIFYLKKGL